MSWIDGLMNFVDPENNIGLNKYPDKHPNQPIKTDQRQDYTALSEQPHNNTHTNRSPEPMMVIRSGSSSSSSPEHKTTTEYTGRGPAHGATSYGAPVGNYTDSTRQYKNNNNNAININSPSTSASPVLQKKQVSPVGPAYTNYRDNEAHSPRREGSSRDWGSPSTGPPARSYSNNEPGLFRSDVPFQPGPQGSREFGRPSTSPPSRIIRDANTSASSPNGNVAYTSASPSSQHVNSTSQKTTSVYQFYLPIPPDEVQYTSRDQVQYKREARDQVIHNMSAHSPQASSPSQNKAWYSPKMYDLDTRREVSPDMFK